MTTPGRLTLLIFAALLAASCSEPSGPRLPESEENEENPQEEPGVTFVVPALPAALA